jgi:hypothetical protein
MDNLLVRYGKAKASGRAWRAKAGGQVFRVRKNPLRIWPVVMGLLMAGAAVTMTMGIMHPSSVRAQSIPTNASGGCPVASGTFNGWFESGSPSVNGVVKPADSLAFSGSSLCAFHEWSEQMFLWLLSPAPTTYGGGAHIFDSPTFYDVSPLDASGQRTMTKHVSGRFPIVGIRVPIPGPHGLPVFLDKKNRLFEVQPAKLAPNGKQLILNKAGKEVEIESFSVAKGKVVFKDTRGKSISSPKPILPLHLLKPVTAQKATLRGGPQAAQKITIKPESPQLSKAQVVQRFVFKGKPIFLDPLGFLVTPASPEEGQATGDALLSQANSLVYYTLVVNDVFAYFLTGNKTGGITPAAMEFPTNSGELASVTSFASTRGVTFPDPNALAVEVKMSWVDASTISDTSKYITISANVPNYTTSDPSHWVPDGTTRRITLALVGVHVVGSTASHPEMIWATFEHFGNTPNAAYTYTTTSGNTTIPQDSTGSWLFCVTNCPTGSTFNAPHAQLSGADIVGVPSGSSISASNTLRSNPWGLPGTVAGNVSSNTQIVSINNSVLSQLLSGDMRKNYFMLGSTWTIGGAPPSSGTQVGTSALANSTMETYVQGASNCFSCHDDLGVANGMLGISADSGLSHIYFPIRPL